MLAHPSRQAETRLVTDASNHGMGASLEQKLDGTLKPLAFFSKKFNTAQRVYSAYDRELTAIYEAITHFKYFLEGQNFMIVTDHKPLVRTLVPPRRSAFRNGSYIREVTSERGHINNSGPYFES